MIRTRKSGILLHITSLPGDQGIGNFGPAAFQFVDFLASTGQGLWQVLPLGPTGFGNSPYQSYSAFAGNPLLISLEQLVSDGWLAPSDLAPPGTFSADIVDFDAVVPFQRQRLQKAFKTFNAKPSPQVKDEFGSFIRNEAGWLDDYALFQAVKTAHGGVAWHAWPSAIRAREPAAIKKCRDELRSEIEYEQFVQFLFFRQWTALKTFANENGIAIIGDLPIFVAHDSADVWANQGLFELHEDGKPKVVAGVPPDYFSPTGQLWGNPLYRWEVMARTRYAWWVERVRSALTMFDRIRLDHFRGFESYWEVPGDATIAAGGRWAAGPGAALFERLHKEFTFLPIIAEDLGVITPEVEALRDQFGFPGMRVLQFAFGDDPKAGDYQPHNYLRHCVAYTGTHDNDTTVGWFKSEGGTDTTRTQEQVLEERARTLRYIGRDGSEIHWDMIRLALASVADSAVFPLQDALGLDTEARMNMPGTTKGNWSWRFQWEMLTPEIHSRLTELTTTYERSPPKLKPTVLPRESELTV